MSTRPASSRRAAGSTGRWSRRPGAGQGTPTSSPCWSMPAPAGPWHYPDDQLSDLPTRLLATEITREHLYLQLGQELPYASTVEHEKWEEKPDGSVLIHQVILVE